MENKEDWENRYDIPLNPEGLNNRAKKKFEAEVHNESQNIINNILTAGECGKCKAPLFMYLKSAPENKYKYYCTNKCEKGSILEPEDGDIIFGGIESLKAFVDKWYEKGEQL
jgi:hypothetical protein